MQTSMALLALAKFVTNTTIVTIARNTTISTAIHYLPSVHPITSIRTLHSLLYKWPHCANFITFYTIRYPSITHLSLCCTACILHSIVSAIYYVANLDYNKCLLDVYSMISDIMEPFNGLSTGPCLHTDPVVRHCDTLYGHVNSNASCLHEI